MTMPSFETVAAGEASLTVAPALGGAIVSWMRSGRSILRPPVAGAIEAGSARGLGAFPLVPYSNRIAKGRFRFGGVDYQLPATFGGNAIHGVGWQSQWRSARPAPGRIVLTLDHAPDEFWPFAFKAEQSFSLTGDTLVLAIMVRNTHPAPAPFGFGLHPFFPREPGATLRFAARDVWENGPDMIPDRRTPLPPGWDHASARLIGSVELDNCFNGWDGSARIEYPESGLAISIEADPVFQHAVVFVPPGKDFFAVEPVTNMNDGVNRMDEEADHGVTILPPDGTFAGTIRFRLQTIG